MAKRNSGQRTGNRTANRQAVLEDDDDDEGDDQMSDAELLAQIRSAAGRNNGNLEAAALGYLRDIRKLRQQRNKARQAYNDLLEEFPDGHFTVVGEEAESLRSLLEGRKLDVKKLADLIGKLENDLATERSTNLKNSEQLLFSRIAELTGYDRDAIATVVRNGGYTVELKQKEIDGTGADRGKKIKQDWPFVRPKGDDKAAFVDFDEAVNNTQKYMRPALEQGSQRKQTATPGSSAVIDSIPAPRGGSEGGNLVSEFLEKDKKSAEGRYDPMSFIRGGAGNGQAVRK